MIIIISPAKSQNFSPLELDFDFTQPIFKSDVKSLIKKLKLYQAEEIAKLMKISENLATEVVKKYNKFDPNKFDTSNAKSAIFTFNGDVYKTLDTKTLKPDLIKYAQDHLLILSGLYGLLRPLDLIQAYRLEMGIKIDKTLLYKYWQNKITAQLNQLFQKHKNKTLINLASNEYSQAIKLNQLNANCINIDFKENKNGMFKTIGIHAKKARGLMTRFILENKIKDVQDIKKFDIEKYKYNPSFSKDSLFCFTR